MDAGPGTDLGSFGWFLGIWLTMMTAMMLPSAAPVVLLFSELRRDAPAWAFAGGYLLAWTGAGLWPTRASEPGRARALVHRLGGARPLGRR